MSDKGDIDVGLALHLTRCISNKHDDIRHDIGLLIVQELRSHGWLHEDDKVEGRTIETCHKADDPNKCQDYFDGICWKCPWHKPRTALVKDMIK